MSLLKSRVFLVLIFLIGLYFLLRLPNLTLQPIFADEAIYIRWAQIAKAEPTLRFISVSDGKTPLFMWAMMPLFNIFQDPLLAGRFLSVICGVFTLLGVYFLGKQVFNQRVGILATLLYAVTPYTVFFDRMALVDGMLTTFSIWSLNLAIWLIKEQKFKLSVALGILLGSAWLTKTPAQINFVSLPATLVAFNFKSKISELLKLFFLWGLAVFIAFVMYNSLRLGQEFHQLAARNSDYVFPLSRLLVHPLDPFIPHLGDIKDWFPKLLTWPVLGLIVYSLWLIVKTKNRLGMAILLWALIPLFILTLLLKTFTARYLLPPIPILLVIAGYGMEKIYNLQFTIYNRVRLFIFLVLLIPAAHFDYQLITNPPPDNLPREERRGYFEDWTAGYGFYEIAQFLKEERKKGLVVVGTEGSFGTLPDGLKIYLDKDDIPVIGGGALISEQIRQTAKEKTTFFIANKSRVANQPEKTKLIKEYPKATPLGKEPKDAILIYQVLP